MSLGAGSGKPSTKNEQFAIGTDETAFFERNQQIDEPRAPRSGEASRRDQPVRGDRAINRQRAGETVGGHVAHPSINIKSGGNVSPTAAASGIAALTSCSSESGGSRRIAVGSSARIEVGTRKWLARTPAPRGRTAW